MVKTQDALWWSSLSALILGFSIMVASVRIPNLAYLAIFLFVASNSLSVSAIFMMSSAGKKAKKDIMIMHSLYAVITTLLLIKVSISGDIVDKIMATILCMFSNICLLVLYKGKYGGVCEEICKSNKK